MKILKKKSYIKINYKSGRRTRELLNISRIFQLKPATFLLGGMEMKGNLN